MLDITKQSAEATMTLDKLVPTRSSEADGKLSVGMEFSYTFGDVSEARVADVAVPGAERMWLRTHPEGDGRAAGGTTKVKPLDPYMRAILAPAEGDPIALDIEVKDITVNATPTACVFRLRFLAYDVTADGVGRMAAWLGCSIRLAVEARGQQKFDFTRPKVGQIVSGVDRGKEYAGFYRGTATDEATGEMLEVDDFGTVTLVRPASISGAFSVDTQPALLKQAQRLGAGWTHLVVALGQAYLGKGAVQPWKLTREIVNEAGRLASQASA